MRLTEGNTQYCIILDQNAKMGGVSNNEGNTRNARVLDWIHAIKIYNT